jgi:hypothetical protein
LPAFCWAKTPPAKRGTLITIAIANLRTQNILHHAARFGRQTVAEQSW